MVPCRFGSFITRENSDPFRRRRTVHVDIYMYALYLCVTEVIKKTQGSMSLQIFDGLYEEGEYVDMRTKKTIGGIKTFIDDLVSLAGAHAITIRPFVGQGESSLRLQRMSDGSEPQHGDTWVVGQGAGALPGVL